MRYIATLVLCLIISIVNAQVKLEGIGKYKIGKTTIEELSTEPIKKITFSYERVGVAPEFVELGRNEEEPDQTPDRTPYSTALRVFYTDRFEVGGVAIQDFYLTFFNGVLYKINCTYSDELRDALTLKYGKPKVSGTSTPVKCVYRLTGRASAPKNNQSKFFTWGSGQVTATYHYSLMYDSNCEGVYNEFFHVIDTTKMKEVISEEKAAINKAKATSQAAKQKALSEF